MTLETVQTPIRRNDQRVLIKIEFAAASKQFAIGFFYTMEKENKTFVSIGNHGNGSKPPFSMPLHHQNYNRWVLVSRKISSATIFPTQIATLMTATETYPTKFQIGLLNWLMEKVKRQ